MRTYTLALADPAGTIIMEKVNVAMGFE